MGTSRLGNLLVEEGLLSETDRRTIKRTCGTHGSAFARSVLALGLLDEDELAAFLAERTQWRLASKDLLKDSQKEAWSMIDRPLIERLEVIPLRLVGRTLHVAMVDPLDRDTLKQLEFFTGYKIQPVISTLSQIRLGLQKLLKTYKPNNSHLEELITNHVGSASRRLRVIDGAKAPKKSAPAPKSAAIVHEFDDADGDVALEVPPAPVASAPAPAADPSAALEYPESVEAAEAPMESLDDGGETLQELADEEPAAVPDIADSGDIDDGEESVGSGEKGPALEMSDAELGDLESAFSAEGDGDLDIASMEDDALAAFDPDEKEKAKSAPGLDEELAGLGDSEDLGNDDTGAGAKKNPAMDTEEFGAEFGAGDDLAAEFGAGDESVPKAEPPTDDDLLAGLEDELGNSGNDTAPKDMADDALAGIADLEDESGASVGDNADGLGLDDIAALEADDSPSEGTETSGELAGALDEVIEAGEAMETLESLGFDDDSPSAPAAPSAGNLADELLATEDAIDTLESATDLSSDHGAGDFSTDDPTDNLGADLGAGDLRTDDLDSLEETPDVPTSDLSADDHSTLDEAAGADEPSALAEIADEDLGLDAFDATNESAAAKKAPASPKAEDVPTTAPDTPALLHAAALNRALFSLTMAASVHDAVKRVATPLAAAGLKQGLVLELSGSAVRPLSAWEQAKGDLTTRDSNLGSFVAPGLGAALNRTFPGWTTFEDAVRGDTLKPFAKWRDAKTTLFATAAPADGGKQLVVITAWDNASKDDASLRQVTMDVVRKLAKKVGA